MDIYLGPLLFLALPLTVAGVAYLYLQRRAGKPGLWRTPAKLRKVYDALGPDADHVTAALNDVWAQETAAARNRVRTMIESLANSSTRLREATARRAGAQTDVVLQFSDGTLLTVSNATVNTIGDLEVLQRNLNRAQVRVPRWDPPAWIAQRRGEQVLFDVPAIGTTLAVRGTRIEISSAYR